mmetsp:Transcript_18228/g.42445  ORF Transcript_18228/g.42445 Transcript_18228/m.42445 type:complete len:201 (-) Transcript_18228:25-627(-)
MTAEASSAGALPGQAEVVRLRVARPPPIPVLEEGGHREVCVPLPEMAARSKRISLTGPVYFLQQWVTLEGHHDPAIAALWVWRPCPRTQETRPPLELRALVPGLQARPSPAQQQQPPLLLESQVVDASDGSQAFWASMPQTRQCLQRRGHPRHRRAFPGPASCPQVEVPPQLVDSPTALLRRAVPWAAASWLPVGLPSTL